MTETRRFPRRQGHPPEPTSLVPAWAGQFTTFQDWVNKAPTWIDRDAVCVDAKGRRCVMGGDFHRAHNEGAFPVRFFWECHRVASGRAVEDQMILDGIGEALEGEGFVHMTNASGVRSLARAAHERDKLAEGIAKAAERAGIYNGEAPLDGPSLLQLLEDMASSLNAKD